MFYVPVYIGDPPTAAEFQRLSQVLQEMQELQFPIIYIAPDKPRVGMVRYADGTEWDPGSGEGLYVYKSGGWTLLA